MSKERENNERSLYENGQNKAPLGSVERFERQIRLHSDLTYSQLADLLQANFDNPAQLSKETYERIKGIVMEKLAKHPDYNNGNITPAGKGRKKQTA